MSMVIQIEQHTLIESNLNKIYSKTIQMFKHYIVELLKLFSFTVDCKFKDFLNLEK